MAGYIEREAAIEWFMPYVHMEESIDADIVISDIKGMKADDVAPVRHGRWIKRKTWDFHVCSECSFETRPYMSCMNYCQNCGAKMDLGDAQKGGDEG